MRYLLRNHVLMLWLAVMVGAVAAVGLIDEYVYKSQGWTFTMSWQLKTLARDHPNVPFVLGMAIGGLVFGIAAHILTTMPKVETWDEFVKLKEDARKWYLPDGTFVVMRTPSDVVARRKRLAADVAALCGKVRAAEPPGLPALALARSIEKDLHSEA
jgi:hypothetical protein